MVFEELFYERILENMNIIEFILFFGICVIILSLNITLVAKFKDKTIPIFFIVFGTLLNMYLFNYSVLTFTYPIALLFIGLSIYINAQAFLGDSRDVS